MIPNFALSLSFEGIRLLKRANTGWLLVDEVALDDPALSQKIRDMRTKAARLDPAPLRTKLLIPNDQIRYMALDDPRAGDDEIRAALDGATPYALDELVFDFCRSQSQTFVAAIARETLEEASGFAQEYGFNPVSYAAVPETGTYLGEPFFGRVKTARLEAGETVERDAQAVRVVGIAQIPPEPKPEPEPQPEPAPVVEPAAPVVLEDLLDGDLTELVDQASLPEDPEVVPETTTDETTDTPSDTAVVVEPVTAEPAAEEPVTAPATEAVEPPLVDIPVVTPEATIPPEEPLPAIVFATRNKPAPTEGDTPVPVIAAKGAAPVGAAPRITPGATRITITPQDADAPLVAPAKPAGTDTPEKAGTAALASVGDLAGKAATALKDRSARRKEAKAAKSMAALEARAKEVADTLEAGKPLTEEDQLTVFGARKPQKPKHWRPKYLGLILTVILLLFLAAVAVWASFTEEGIARLWGGSKVTEVAAIEEAQPVTTPEEDLAAIEAELAADMPDTEAAIEAIAPDGVLLPPSALPAGQVLPPAEAQRLYAATGIWQRAPTLPALPRTESSDDVKIAAIDPVTIGTDAVALPHVTGVQPDPSYRSPVAPPAAGAEFDRDAFGFIRATAQGTLLPTGVVVYLAPAGSAPAQRPEGLVPEAGPETANPDILAASGRPLASLRPTPRPETMGEQIERDALGGYTNSELAGKRPVARTADFDIPEPQPVPPEPEVTEIPDPDVAAIAAAIAAAAPPDLTAGASALAIPASPTPAARPRNFDRVVTAAQPAPAPEEEAPAPTERSAVIAPTGPVPGGVANAATDERVLALREMSLIGVAGNASNRVAIVRMGNGRIYAVHVGDTLDGGQVTAISENALNYVKRGRTYGLQMPR